ncbi:malonyl-ACP O-methyltransferase BioC [Coxiella endosymbiont of Ornithodoros amblus]|uniref:malonyl-ACP O-methyltransferase BioC n=1 Tax=Coxiella endosymbiont of Ornithodoros amblus TaxID=1656166 RepID=UPI00244DC69B|nr:malonyl-ACP O-methyltransferase BioC [Coxiella endosymbiont of Ornithodoros amblus]MBW5803099.1 malonyl-ACP O-methyltransferase BioC [Coxiella endosymbiont of Ornithodoros amblus]
MMINSLKKRIQRSFNKAFDTYDDYALIQQKICKQLLTLLKEMRIQTKIIADFACGTGISTKAVANSFPYKNLYAIDFCEKLLMQAKSKLKESNVEFILADFENNVFFYNSLDLIFCNMGFQWALDLKQTFFILFSQLKALGVLAFSVPLIGTFCELRNDCRNPFLTVQSIVHLLKDVGFELLATDEKIFTDSFESILDAIRSIKSIGANCLLYPKRKKGLSPMPIEKYNTNTKLTYHIGFFIAKKIIQ